MLYTAVYGDGQISKLIMSLNRSIIVNFRFLPKINRKMFVLILITTNVLKVLVSKIWFTFDVNIIFEILCV